MNFFSKLISGGKSAPQEEPPHGGSGAPTAAMVQAKDNAKPDDAALAQRLEEAHIQNPEWIIQALRTGDGPLIDMLNTEIGSRDKVYSTIQDVQRLSKEKSEIGSVDGKGNDMMTTAVFLAVSCISLDQLCLLLSLCAPHFVDRRSL